MRIYRISFFLLISLILSCKQQKTGVLITGKIKNSATNSLFLQIGEQKDTIKVDKNGQFEYQFKTSTPEFVRIIVPQTEKKLLLLVDTLDQINLSFDANNPDSSSVIEGSKGTTQLHDIQRKYFETLQKMQAINQQFEKEKQYATEVTFDAIRQKAIDSLKSSIDSEISFILRFIKNNPYSLASITALYQSFDTETGRPLLLDVPNGLHYYEMVDSNLSAHYPKSNTVQNFHQAVVALKMSETKQYDARTTAEKPLLKKGDLAPDFEITGIDNKTHKLSDFRGKTILLDFWASWCPPCRELNPNLVKVYNAYHTKGFDIFQVSLDKTIDALKEAISKDALPWKTQTCDFKSWESPIAQLYLVKEIPQNFLIDKEGKIIAINCNGNTLNKELKKILK